VSQSDADTEPYAKPQPGVQIKVAGHRLTLPIATVLGSILAALGTAYEVVRRDRAEVIERLAAVECLTAKLDHQREIADVRQLEVAASLARIETQLAELRAVMLRRGAP
jgi:hypothetical protein